LITVSFIRGELPTVHLAASRAAITWTTAAVQAAGAATFDGPTDADGGGTDGDALGVASGLGDGAALGVGGTAECVGFGLVLAVFAADFVALPDPPPKAQVASTIISARMTAATSPRRRQ
jgi:hypothetical protein